MGIWPFQRKTRPAEPAFAISGHGMLFAPICPCRITLNRDSLLVCCSSGAFSPDLMIREGRGPASTPPAPLPNEPREYSLGPDGPTIRRKPHVVALEDVISEMLVSPKLVMGAPPGLREPWFVLGKGLMFGLPPDVVLHSTTDGSLPELHLPNTPEAFVRVDLVPSKLSVVEIKGIPDSDEVHFEGGNENVRRWQTRYIHAGTRWIQHFYGIAIAGVSTVIRAQAPESVWDEMEAAAVFVAGSVGPSAEPRSN